MIQKDYPNGVIQYKKKNHPVIESQQFKNDTRFLYNGDFFRTSWPTTLMKTEKLTFKFIPQEGSKFVEYGKVQVIQNSEVINTLEDCRAGD